MKKFRKIMAVLVAAMMIMASMTITAFASSYVITINNALASETYTAYRIFELTDSNEGGGTYVLTDDTAYGDKNIYWVKTSTQSASGNEIVSWSHDPAYVNGSTIADRTKVYELREGVAYTIKNNETNGWYTRVAAYIAQSGDEGIYLAQSAADEHTFVVTFDETKFKPADFAKWLKADLDNNVTHSTWGSAATAAVPAGGSANGVTDATNGTATIDVGYPGYYLVDTSLGSLVALDTASAAVTVYEKNTAPKVTKKISVDGTTYGDGPVDVDEGDEVFFKLILEDGKGTDSEITVVDTMEPGLTLDPTSFAVKKGGTSDVGNTYYDITVSSTQKVTSATADVTAPDSITTYTADGTSFKVTFTAGYVKDSLDTGDTVEITFKAILNRAAEIYYTSDPQTNDNTVYLTYSNQTTAPVTVSTQTYAFRVKKVIEGTSTALQGVKFKLTKTENAATYYYTNVSDGGTAPITTTATIWGSDPATMTTDSNGYIDFYGLDVGEYLLTETETLAGYNLLTDTITINVAADGVVTAYKTSDANKTNIVTAASGTAATTIVPANFTIENTPGQALPSTGGMGTTVLYIVGGMLVILAGAYLFFSRKRTA